MSIDSTDLRITQLDQLIVGRWYLLVARQRDDAHADEAASPIAEYIGDGDFVDDDMNAYRAGGYDYFVAQ